MREFLTLGEAAEFLGVAEQTLRRWHDNGKFKASHVTPGGHRMYSLADLQLHTKSAHQIALEWASGNVTTEPEAKFYCRTQDVFKARLERMVSDVAGHAALAANGSLITSALGEIGNNCFDHNLGNWPDVPGAFFTYDLGKKTAVLADRGQGVLRTLRHARPSIADDAGALTVAFTEILTGRAPEHRGNGLKFVRKVVQRCNYRLVFRSGNAEVRIEPNSPRLTLRTHDTVIRGSLAFMEF